MLLLLLLMLLLLLLLMLELQLELLLLELRAVLLLPMLQKALRQQLPRNWGVFFFRVRQIAHRGHGAGAPRRARCVGR